MMKQINVGVIGLGSNGRSFCDRYMTNSRTKLVAICDVDNERLTTCIEKYKVRGYSDYDILNNRDMDLISIHTPDHLHKEAFVRAVESKHHVFVEKPMADTEKDLREMVSVAEQHPGKVYAVGHILRFDKYFSLIKKWIDSGILGDIFYMECDYIHDLRMQQHMENWKISKEIPMLGGGCHPLDLLRWYAGDVDEVMSLSNHIAYPEMREDASMVSIFTFKSGCIGKVTSLYGNVGPSPHSYNLSVYGTKGTIVRDKVSFDGMEQEWMELPVDFDKTHDFMTEIDHLADCIFNKTEALVSPREGAKSSLAGLYAVLSAKEKKLIKVPEIQ
jgi:UDP-N-acetylglucosamine 3-dehydrogenase